MAFARPTVAATLRCVLPVTSHMLERDILLACVVQRCILGSAWAEPQRLHSTEAAYLKAKNGAHGGRLQRLARGGPAGPTTLKNFLVVLLARKSEF